MTDLDDGIGVIAPHNEASQDLLAAQACPSRQSSSTARDRSMVARTRYQDSSPGKAKYSTVSGLNPGRPAIAGEKFAITGDARHSPR